MLNIKTEKLLTHCIIENKENVYRLAYSYVKNKEECLISCRTLFISYYYKYLIVKKPSCGQKLVLPNCCEYSTRFSAHK